MITRTTISLDCKLLLEQMTSSVVDILYDFSPQVTHNLIFLLPQKQNPKMLPKMKQQKNPNQTNKPTNQPTHKKKKMFDLSSLCCLFSTIKLETLYFKSKGDHIAAVSDFIKF